MKLDEEPRRPYPESPGGLCRRAGNQIADAHLPAPSASSTPSGAVSSVLSRIAVMTHLSSDDRPSLRNYDLGDIGGGDCTDGMPGQQVRVHPAPAAW